ncbi:MAG: Asp-tRNA(Asn)/Glu-tRNA(Gln) amidotransferase subunit GatB [Candidatus Limnocylindrales bacterium]|jgi:aspartyl-tRNA(Asn)/glutamyl-tRNA(Gln) amidotransferase subunit B
MTIAPTAGGRSAALERYEAVIGIEIHCQLKTVSKMFCGCSTDIDGATPNSHCCPVCLGLPGVLPTINKTAVEYVIATGFAIEATVAPTTRWDRKNYFYPDLPKGYQISQYQLPLAADGRLTFDTSDGPFTVRVRRAHLEEDTGRLIHSELDGRRVSLIDFNRSGMPLMEIVTEPDIRTAEQARRYAEELRLLMRTIGASDAEMENGQMRVEANVSIRPRGREAFGTRVEVKNMNSMRAVERAIAFEIERQAAAIDADELIHMETRGWDEARQSTYHMRPKEEENDYRYFPEPDLPPLLTSPEWLAEIKARLPELPSVRRRRYREAHGLSVYDADVLVNDAAAAALFEGALAAGLGVPAKLLANWVTGEYMRLAKGGEGSGEGQGGRVDPTELATLVKLVADGVISGTNAKEVFAEHFASGSGVASIVGARGFRQISDAGALGTAIERVLAAHPAAVADYRAGKAAAVGFLVGQVMKATRGQANAGLVQTALRERLDRAE